MNIIRSAFWLVLPCLCLVANANARLEPRQFVKPLLFPGGVSNKESDDSGIQANDSSEGQGGVTLSDLSDWFQERPYLVAQEKHHGKVKSDYHHDAPDAATTVVEGSKKYNDKRKKHQVNGSTTGRTISKHHLRHPMPRRVLARGRNDNRPSPPLPTVSIDSPSDGYATNAEEITVDVSFENPDGGSEDEIGDGDNHVSRSIHQVDLLHNGEVIDTHLYSPPVRSGAVSFSVDLTNAEEMVHEFQARAFKGNSRAGNAGYSPVVTFVVDRTPPVINVELPESADTTTNEAFITVRGSAVDSLSGLDSLMVGDQVFQEETFEVEDFPLETTVPEGAISARTLVQIQATDRAGNSEVETRAIHYTPPDFDDVDTDLAAEDDLTPTGPIDCILDAMQMDDAFEIEQSIYDMVVGNGRTSTALEEAFVVFCEDEADGLPCLSFLERIAGVYGYGECQNEFGALSQEQDPPSRGLEKTSEMVFVNDDLQPGSNDEMIIQPHSSPRHRRVGSDPFTEKVDVCAQVLVDLLLPVSEYNCYPLFQMLCFWEFCVPIPNPVCLLVPGLQVCCTPVVCLVSPICGFARNVPQLFEPGGTYCFEDVTVGDLWERVKERSISIAWSVGSLALELPPGVVDLFCEVVKLDIEVMYNNALPLHPEVIALLQEIREADNTPLSDSWDASVLGNIKIDAKENLGANDIWVQMGAITLGHLVLFDVTDYYELLTTSPPRNSLGGPVTLLDLQHNNTGIDYYVAINILLHELVHTRQYSELGICSFYKNYLLEVVFNGYDGASYEVEAYTYDQILSPLEICGYYCTVFYLSRDASLGDAQRVNMCRDSCPVTSFGCSMTSWGINPCQNSGACVEGGAEGYTCDCSYTGFTGQHCETNIDDCDPNPCQNGGICTDGINSYTCDCSGTGFRGSRCQININDCYSNSCQNGGTCIDGVNSYTCDCSGIDFEGPSCQTHVDDCDPDPCQNGGSCIDGIKSYTCDCSGIDFEGPNCETHIDDCDPNPCENGGICTDGINSYTCDCSGTDFTGSNCETHIDDCDPNPCENGGICTDGINSYTCDCSDTGFMGQDCEINIDDCIPDACENGGVCRDRVKSYWCDCSGTGYRGTRCQYVDYPCSPNPCRNGGSCVDEFDSYTCDCTGTGFTGSKCQLNINDCFIDACLNGGTCIDGVNSYTCDCSGIDFEGPNCETHVDDCDPDPCQNEGTCIDGIKSYTCDCANGFTGQDCEINIDDCDPNPCQNDGICTDGIHSYTCVCSEGFMGQDCEINIDDCGNPNPCQNGGICIDGINSHTCDCTGTGFGGSHCDVDYCDPDPCLNGGTCTGGIDGYTCDCFATGFGGLDCEIDHCGSNLCENGSACVGGVDGYTCDCTGTGFMGQFCETNIDYCDPNPCLHGGTCTDGNPANGIDGFLCDCSGTGYDGSRCDIDIDPCDPNPCLNGGGCVDLNDNMRYSCDCVSGYTGEHCEVFDYNPCDPNPCYNGGTCSVHENGVNPVCDCSGTGFGGFDCRNEINECLPNPCQNGGTCIDEINSYRCLCTAFYTGDNCETSIDPCDPNPCLSGGICSYDPNSDFICSCAPGYSGTTCDLYVCDPNPCQNGGTCHLDNLGMYYCNCYGTGYQGYNCDW